MRVLDALPGPRARARGARGRRAEKRGRRARNGRAGARGNDVVSPMHGVVVEVTVAAGEAVEEGQVVAVIEAMKMMNEIRAHRAGTIATVHAHAGRDGRSRRAAGHAIVVAHSAAASCAPPWRIGALVDLTVAVLAIFFQPLLGPLFDIPTKDPALTTIAGGEYLVVVLVYVALLRDLERFGPLLWLVALDQLLAGVIPGIEIARGHVAATWKTIRPDPVQSAA